MDAVGFPRPLSQKGQRHLASSPPVSFIWILQSLAASTIDIWV